MFSAMNKSQETEIRLRLFEILSEESNLSQREIAQRMGISLGKANYCISEFVKKGFVKMQRFSDSKAKFRYLYVLTPMGVEEKSLLAFRFLKRKLREYEEIKRQIQELGRNIKTEDLPSSEAGELADLISQAAD